MAKKRMTTEEINARIEEINARLDAIDVMLDNEEAELTNSDGSAATIEQINSEYESLMSELEQLEQEKQANEAEEGAAQRKAQRRAAVANAGACALHTRSSKASESFIHEKRTSISGKETRSILVSSGKIATPTGVQNNISDGFNMVSSIVDQVNVEDLTGMGEYLIPYEKSLPEAGEVEENEKSKESDPDFGIAKVRPTTISVLSYLSREVSKQSPALYEQKVRESALKALKKKAAHIIVQGSSSDTYGIYNAKNTKDEVIYDSILMNENIGPGTLRKIVYSYGGEENVIAGCRLFLSKNDLIAFGDVRGKNELKAIYKITPDGNNPNTGIIEDGGLFVPYTICSDVTSYTSSEGTAEGVNTMIYGDPYKFTLGLFGSYEVRVSDDYKFGERLLSIMGEVTIGGNINSDKGFLVVKKKNS